jgi:hypothetical protein
VKVRRKHRKEMLATHPFYREIDARLESAFAEIDQPARHDVNAGQEAPAVGHRGARDKA